MKKILIAGVLAVVAASPALAASRHHRNAAADSYAYVPATASAYGPTMGTYAVSNGQLLGADPDPFIRESLIRQGSPADFNN
ncbi:MAG: hypothetical protein JSR72_12425 [Proteobacteria bacterium]|nr:hypothetical protein [Pseudomonadota bacterium]